MKKLITILTLIIFVISCSPKSTPCAGVSLIPKPDSSQALAGKEIFTAKCGKCHELKNPGDYTPTKWIGLINEMAPKAQLTDEEKQHVLAYVQANAKQ
jgi:hypothetical protein